MTQSVHPGLVEKTKRSEKRKRLMVQAYACMYSFSGMCVWVSAGQYYYAITSKKLICQLYCASAPYSPVRCKPRTGCKRSVPSEAATDGSRREDGIGCT